MITSFSLCPIAKIHLQCFRSCDTKNAMNFVGTESRELSEFVSLKLYVNFINFFLGDNFFVFLNALWHYILQWKLINTYDLRTEITWQTIAQQKYFVFPKVKFFVEFMFPALPIDKRADGRTEWRRTNGRTDGRTDWRRTDGQTTSGRTDGWMDG